MDPLQGFQDLWLVRMEHSSLDFLTVWHFPKQMFLTKCGNLCLNIKENLSANVDINVIFVTKKERKVQKKKSLDLIYEEFNSQKAN